MLSEKADPTALRIRVDWNWDEKLSSKHSQRQCVIKAILGAYNEDNAIRISISPWDKSDSTPRPANGNNAGTGKTLFFRQRASIIDQIPT